MSKVVVLSSDRQAIQELASDPLFTQIATYAYKHYVRCGENLEEVYQDFEEAGKLHQQYRAIGGMIPQVNLGHPWEAMKMIVERDQLA